MIFINRSC